MSQAIVSLRLNEALLIARARNASDVHLSAGNPVVFRVDGNLEPQDLGVISAAELNEAITCWFKGRAGERLQVVGDATVAHDDPDAGTIRIHASASRSQYSLAIRMLAREIPAFETLHLPPVIGQFIQRNHGLVIFTGPTGSGKSTTMAALLDRINRFEAKHIVTIEDPIEYRHRPVKSIVSQRQVGVDVPGFNEALIGALRSDPDVILVGEMRDPATMAAALAAAETGHLVLATLHTGSAAESIDRIVGSFAGEMQDQIRMQLAQSLVGVVCLRLVQRANGSGRRCAAEILYVTDAVRSVIREAKVHHIRNIITTGRPHGMQTLEAHLSDLIMSGEVRYDAARLVTDRPNEIRVGGPA